MYCSICTDPRQSEMIDHWAFSESLRWTALRFGVGYRSLHRHFDLCLASILAEEEQREYEKALAESEAFLRNLYKAAVKARPRRSIITKPVKFTWSRRAWKRKNTP